MTSASVETVHVPLEGRSYDIHIGHNLLDRAAGFIAPLLKRPKLVIVADAVLDQGHLPKLISHFQTAGIDCNVLQLPSGEATKSWSHLSQVVEWLLSAGVERGDVVVAFGGGVIGDLVGFAAAIMRRGVRFVQIPSTLLAQVDSSVGGKTAINTPQGKNLVGAFHQPSLVLADIALLDTLTQRDFLAGYGEVVKYGLLGDETFFEWLEQNAAAMVAGDHSARMRAVKLSCEMKAGIVVRDETEQGDRALLNLGHTFCHALEAATSYDGARLLHGEGVAIGCALAFDLSAKMGLCAQEAPSRLRAHLRMMGTKVDLSDIDGDLPDADAMLDLMGQDKKVVQGQLTFVLARAIGEAFVTRDVDRDVVKALLNEALSQRA